jgi:hypothetical protein
VNMELPPRHGAVCQGVISTNLNGSDI